MRHAKSRLVEDADESAPGRLESRSIGTGPHLPFSSSRIHGIPTCRDLVSTAFNSAYPVRLETAPTGPDKRDSKQLGLGWFMGASD